MRGLVGLLGFVGLMLCAHDSKENIQTTLNWNSLTVMKWDAGMEIWDAWTRGSNNNKHVSNRTINLVFGQLAQVRSLLVMPITFMQGCRVVTRVI